MHIPVYDRTSFEGLVKFVEDAVKLEHALAPNKPIYLVGDSFGGCLALSVAARNPSIDLVLVLANPATSFGKSQLQPLLPVLEALPNRLHVTVLYLLSFIMGDLIKMAMVIDDGLPPARTLEQLLGNLTALLPQLSGLADILPKETLLWKLNLLKAGAAYANSRVHAVKAEVLVLASGKDNMLPTGAEAQRLSKSLQNCKVRYFKDNAHTLFLGEEYKLFWPDQPEFVRMAARFGATIVPFGVVGEDDVAELVIDYNDLMNIPFVRDWLKEASINAARVRTNSSGEVANQFLFIPGVFPKIPGRFYYLFGKPVETKGRVEILKDREKASELYSQIKSEVESMMSYLLKKREEDPYRGIIQRAVYRAISAPIDQVPTFKP